MRNDLNTLEMTCFSLINRKKYQQPKVQITFYHHIHLDDKQGSRVWNCPLRQEKKITYFALQCSILFCYCTFIVWALWAVKNSFPKPLFLLCRTSVCNTCICLANKCGDVKIFDGTSSLLGTCALNFFLIISNVSMGTTDACPYSSQ